MRKSDEEHLLASCRDIDKRVAVSEEKIKQIEFGLQALDSDVHAVTHKIDKMNTTLNAHVIKEDKDRINVLRSIITLIVSVILTLGMTSITFFSSLFTKM